MALDILTQDMKLELLKLTRKDLTVTNITRLFSKHTKKENGKFEIIPPKFKTTTKMHLDANEFINKEPVDTTVGSFLWNKLFVEECIDVIIPNGYYNEVINKKTFSAVLNMVSDGLMTKKINTDPTLIEFLKRYEFYSLKLSTLFSPSYTQGLLELNSKVLKEKDRLLANNTVNNVQEMSRVEDALVAMAREELKDDPGMSLFDSGARGSFENDYKNMNLMLGPVGIPGTNEFDFVKSNYIQGLQKEDLVAAGNTVVNAAFPKAVGTKVGGYLTKQFYAVYQSIVVDDDGTDCGTKEGIKVILTKDMVKLFLYQNIMLPSGKIVTLMEDNYKKYLDKKVLIRTPMFCTSDKLCSVCAGRRFYIMGIKNVGLTTGRISNTLLNKSMKNFHISKVQLDVVDVDKLLI